MLFEEKQQEQVPQEQQQQEPQQATQIRAVYPEDMDWDALREQIKREVEEHLALAKKVVEVERTLELVRKPQEILQLASEAAKYLFDIIRKRPDWIVVIEGREFLTFPAWQTLASFFGLYPSIVDIKEIRDAENFTVGFEVTAAVYNKYGEEITRAVARADRYEKVPEYEYVVDKTGKRRRGQLLGYKPRFEHASNQVLLAMAQTRAMRRALWQILNFVVALQGYEPTPAEEIDESEVKAR